MGQWGFGKNGDLAGTVCLFTGEPGTGKTLAAEAVGFETGKPLKVRPTSHLFCLLLSYFCMSAVFALLCKPCKCLNVCSTSHLGLTPKP